MPAGDKRDELLVDFNALTVRVRDWWTGMTAGRRAMIVVVAAVIVALAVFLGQVLGRPQYTVLFSNLEMNEAASIVEKLKELNVPYQLQGEGTILVPAGQVYDLRLQVAGSGVLAGSGVGFELFDQAQMGMTDTQWHLNYIRALQEELRRTIVQYQQVRQARVHLTIPEPSVFITEERPASAAVVLELQPLASLNPEQVRSIMYLVASSVEGMNPQDVRVIDTTGRLLSEGVLEETGEAAVSAVAGRQQELRRQFEKELEQRVQAKLEQILGPGNAVVMVTADLDFTQREVSSTDYGDTSVRSEQVIQEQGSGTGGSTPPVADPNRQPPVYGTVVPGGETNYDRTEETRNYEVDQVQERSIYPPGEVRSISTAVVVNGPVAANTEQQVQDMVSAAIGYQPQRGDRINVMSMAFDRTYVQQAEAEMQQLAAEERRRRQLQQYLTWGATAAVIAVGFILVLMLARRREVMQPAMEMAPALEEMIPPEEVVYRPSELPAEAREAKAKQERVKEIAKERPEEAAQLVKTWLGEE